MVENLTSVIPSIVLGSHVVFVFLILTLVFRKSWGRDIFHWLGRNAVALGFLISFTAIAVSLFYSEIVGFEPCVLCWWQRIFIYPLVVIFGVALWKKISTPFVFAVPLALLGSLVALYHSYANLSGNSLLPCTAIGGACAKVFVMAFGYITIPSMSLTVLFYILLLAWSAKKYEQDNSHS